MKRSVFNRALAATAATLALALGNDFLCLGAGFFDELLALADQLHRLVQLHRQGIAQGVDHFNGILFVYQPTAAEGDAAALQHDVLELVELFEHGDDRFSHGGPGGCSRKLPD